MVECMYTYRPHELLIMAEVPRLINHSCSRVPLITDIWIYDNLDKKFGIMKKLQNISRTVDNDLIINSPSNVLLTLLLPERFHQICQLLAAAATIS